MSGHSKWATTKRAKAVVDAKRGAVFTKLANTITVATREKGGDPDANFSLRLAIDRAKLANMPKENIERAIKRGLGEGNSLAIEELIYEGIGPVNSQWVIRCLTDSKNRSASSVRHVFSKYNGSMTPVMWNFEKKGVIRTAPKELGDLELELIDVGVEDIQPDAEGIVFYSNMADLKKVKDALEARGFVIESADLDYVAKETQTLSNPDDLEKINNFIEALDDLEDVNDYFTNINF
jgi:YebC/PmpR family DNA-binding regulatory protein